MDLLNDYTPVYSQNPANIDLSDSEISENERYADKLVSLNQNRKRKKEYTFDDWCMINSSDLWNVWCIIEEFKKGSIVLDNMDYSSFCDMCYQNSTRT